MTSRMQNKILIGTIIEKVDRYNGYETRRAFRLEVRNREFAWVYIGRGLKLPDPDFVFDEFPIKCKIIGENGGDI